MSASAPPVNQDDDGPEEGEIEDDEDDIILLDGSGSSPQRSSTTSTSVDVYASPCPPRKDSYERDIRHFEHRRTRTTRRRTSGGSKSPYSVASSTRNKPKHSRAGVTQGKENRHIHRHKSPVHVHHHPRKESNERTLTDFKDVSPVRRGSSCSSIDSEERPIERSTHYRYARSSKLDRTKRKSSSSPDSAYIPPKRRAHHSEKCPLMKVLHSVAKETRLIALENSESHAESSSLRQRLLNMGAMPAVQEELVGPPSSKDKNVNSEDSRPSSENSLVKDESKKEVQSESTQTEEIANRACGVVEPDPEIVVLSASEEIGNIELRETTINPVTRDLPDPTSNAEPPVSTQTTKSVSMATSECDDDVEDDDDIGRLRLLALQSKKHEPSPIEDADVLQLRLAALKTAFMKKFRIRKKITIKINSKLSKEDPLSPLDEIPRPFSAASPDEVMTPVDMDLAETDDEAASEHSVSHYSPSDPIPDCYSPSDPIPSHYSPSDPVPEYYSPSNPFPECYSPSDPTGSPILEPSLQDLLPPPPPPDLDLFFPDQNFDHSFHSVSEENTWKPSNFDFEPSDIAAPPPLPPYFRDLLSENPEHFENNDIALEESVTNVEEEESPAPSSEPLEVITNPIAIPDAPPVFVESEVQVVKNLLETTQEENHDDPIPVFISLKSNTLGKTDVSEVTKTITETKSQRRKALEEEEKMLRQRLLLNMANKREKLSQSSRDKELSSTSVKVQEVPPKIVSSKSTKVESIKKVEFNGTVTKTLSTESSASNLRCSPAPLNPPVVKRLIINLEEDSDSCEDYSEAEALGHKCAKNKEKWMLHLKEQEVNPPKKISPGNKMAAIAGKVPSGNIIKVKQALKEKNLKKPFAENLADLESSVERFLKGVRSSHEANSKMSSGSSTVSSNVTPVAVRHLPASQQEEYRRLKQQIAKLEKQRQVTIELQKRGSHGVSKGTRINSSANSTSSKQVVNILSQVLPSSNNASKLLSDTPKRDSKSGNSVSLGAHSSKQTMASLRLLKVTSLQSSPKTVDIKAVKEISGLKSTALANVSNLTVSTNAKKLAIQGPSQKLLKANDVQRNVNLPNQNGLSSLEAALLTERSHVLSELSALANLLSQVDRSLEAESHTATEVSSLIDKLYLAASRWKAQNHSVTDLVEKVAQRQRELSLRHRRCVIASKSCALLGGQLKGKNYRVPLDKADAMRLQLKQVHEKTQNLAKRKTVEQAKRNALEQRAEHCLVKLFSDSSSNVITAKMGQAVVPSPVLKSLEKIKPKPTEAPNRQPTKVSLEVPSGSQATQQKQLISTSTAAVPPPPPPASGKINQLAVKCPPQVNSSMISRALSHRHALNKVRSAKAVLIMAKKKHLHRNKAKVKLKKCCPNTPLVDQDCRRDLSDMDISTDGEEAEKRNKDFGGNLIEVDMSVSPDTSPSPSEVDKGFRNSPSNDVKHNLQNGEPSHKGLSSCSNTAHDTDTASYILGKESIENQTEKNQKSDLEIKSRKCESTTSSRSVLKDYVSPLGGLHVFSSSSSSVKGKPYEGDLYAILCPYDLNGKCQDTDCPFQHQHQQ